MNDGTLYRKLRQGETAHLGSDEFIPGMWMRPVESGKVVDEVYLSAPHGDYAVFDTNGHHVDTVMAQPGFDFYAVEKKRIGGSDART